MCITGINLVWNSRVFSLLALLPLCSRHFFNIISLYVHVYTREAAIVSNWRALRNRAKVNVAVYAADMIK